MATILVFSLTVLFAISSVSSLESSSRVYLNVTDRGYQDLLIAIQPGVSESYFPQLLDEIKEAFTAASRQLYIATRRLAYFKTIRILVPADWADSAEYQQVTWETYDTSDVRINSDGNDQPETQQPGQCGEPGMYMRLSPSYLTNSEVTNRYGSPGQVIMEHKDFEGANDIAPVLRDDTTPEFIVLKDSPQTTTILILDTSGSMSNNPERLELLRQSSSYLIRNVLPDGSRVGIVRFAVGASVLKPITVIDSTETRTSLENALPSRASGGTNIGAGIREATDLLEDDVPSRRRFFLITDGEQTGSVTIAHAMDEVLAANVRVCTVAVGPNADADLEELATATNGKHFSHLDSSSGILLSFIECASDIGATPTAVTTSSEFVGIPGGESHKTVSYVEPALTGGLTAVVSSTTGELNPDDVILTSPSGVMYNSSSDVITANPSFTQIQFDIQEEDTTSGQWELEVTNDDEDTRDFSVIFQPKVLEGATPIEVTSAWALPFVSPPEKQVLYVMVFRGSAPVIEADVTATVTLNSLAGGVGKTVLRPLDNGAEPDSRMNDGTYSAYFTEFSGSGRYGVEIKVEAKDGTRVLVGVTTGAPAPANPAVGGVYQPLEILYEQTGNFNRETIGGSFECRNAATCDADAVDLYPPARIVDLSGTHVDPVTQTVNLTFTAPGDDLSVGNVSHYEIRYSTNFTDLRQNFEESPTVPDNWFVFGDVFAPSPAGHVELFVIRVNQTGSITYTFAVVAFDDAGNRNERSNLVVSSGSLLIPSSVEDFLVYIIAGVVAGLVEDGVIHDIQCELDAAQQQVKKLETQLQSSTNNTRKLSFDLNKQEQYSRRNCVRVYGIKESPHEDTDSLVCQMAREKLSVDLQPHHIDRSHRIGKQRNPKDSGGPAPPRPVIVKLTSYRYRQMLITKRKSLKNTGMGIQEDLTEYNSKLLKAAQQHVKVQAAWSVDGRIFVILHGNGQKTRKKIINCTEDLSYL
ncbi:calcium-activated chloride channel regulator 1-like [Diadema antillarum]|uniref:calcium-activated chloride channel regulator 1-like n=1 Tax=Diadema antillarum TaxID=105358 RepID=UPI003A883A89